VLQSLNQSGMYEPRPSGRGSCPAVSIVKVCRENLSMKALRYEPPLLMRVLVRTRPGDHLARPVEFDYGSLVRRGLCSLDHHLRW
jgi:hypothetical protein